MATKTTKKTYNFPTRWQYYTASMIGSVALLSVLTWCSILAFDDNTVDIIPLIIAVVCLVGLLQAIISIFSSMKSVEITSKELILSYHFQEHQNIIPFSSIKEMQSRDMKKQSHARINESFTLFLHDGRRFEFSKSQFAAFGKLKEICKRSING